MNADINGLSGDANKISKEIGEIKSNNEGLSAIYLKMIGTTDDTKIEFDKSKKTPKKR